MKTTLFERSKLVSSNKNIKRTKAIFWEFKHYPNNKECDLLMCITVENKEPSGGLICAQEEYMKFESEHEAAMWILGSWAHWEKLCSCDWFNMHKLRWDSEKEQKIKDMAKQTLIDAAAAGSVPAAKILYDGKKPSTKSTRKAGRPTVEEKKGALNLELKATSKISDITKRMKKFEQ